MSFIKYFKRLRYIDYLVRRKATGNANELARKLNLSKRAIYNYINDMKELGFPIKYGSDCDCYFYEEKGKMVENLFEKDQSKNELGYILSKDQKRNIQGGLRIYSINCIQSFDC
jgi:hypothetical protein